MRICTISRAPLRDGITKYPQRERHILERLENNGIDIQNSNTVPIKVSNTYLAYGLGSLISLLKFCKMKKPDLILAEDIESGIISLFVKYIFNIPFIFDYIDDYALIASYGKWRLRSKIIRFFEKVIPKYADFVIVVDYPKKIYCLKNGVPEGKLKMIPNGFDSRLFKPDNRDEDFATKLKLENKKVILYAGKIDRYYNIDPIIHAIPLVLKEFPDTVFIFIGDGDHIDQLRNLSGKLGIESSVIFTGFRPHGEIPKFIHLADVCVFPLPDSSALSIFEYMACGKPTVLPKGGTEKMWISPEMIPEDCVVMSEGNAEGFSEGIKFLLKNDKIRKEMGQKAREIGTRYYDWDFIAKELEKTIRKVSRNIA